MRHALLISTAALLLAATPALAAGPPPSTTQVGQGIEALGGGVSYDAIQRGAGTFIQRDAGSRGRLSRVIGGHWGIPAVANDGSASGLSADGRTLVVAAVGTRFPVHRTRYLVLDAGTLRIRERVTLPGTFSFDAVSPDGNTLYLIRYKGGNPTDYAVRAYDVSAGRLLAKPIVDPREPDEKMTGIPVTRTYSHDGVWAYTLYAGDKPFVHALDTRDRTARCIDVPPGSVSGDSTTALRLSRDGRRLSVVEGLTPMAIVDTRTFKVSTPIAAAPAPKATAPRAQSDDGGGSTFPWALVGGILAALMLAAAAVTVAARRYAGSASPE